MLSDRLALWLLHDYLGLNIPDLLSTPIAVPDLSPYEGTYLSNQMRVNVKAVDGQLEELMTYEPLDNAQARIFAGFSGGQSPFPSRRLIPVGDGLFAPVGVPLETFKGYMRVMLVSFHGRTNGRATHRTTGGRMTHRQAE